MKSSLQSNQKYVDVSTVISMLPYPILETKPGLIPERWTLGAAAKGDFRLLTVGRCFHPVYIDENRPRLIVPDPSDIVAQSLVQDHKTAMFGYVHQEAEPGIAWVTGEYEDTPDGKKAIKALYPDLLESMYALQQEWFKNLVRLADDNWAKYKQHKFITDLERIAAEHLELTSREWLIDARIEDAMSKCKFCFAQVHPLACLCPSCKGILDMDRYKREFLGAGDIEVVRKGTNAAL